MTLRTVRLPATVSVENVQIRGTEGSISVAADGSITAELGPSGVLVVAGQPIPSPGQLVELWTNAGKIEFSLLDAELGPNDQPPAMTMARLSAYTVGLEKVDECRKKGLNDAQIAEVLKGIRELTASQTRDLNSEQKASFNELDRLLREMIEDWERTLPYRWSEHCTQ
ncbi:hypothetical protein [Kitasatospora sp. NPDC096204]|uniref:hypothetical protein n=1 Tax=Kitasatospora sp. NPDC096204 TaxID=3364094 RepID=UPI0037FB9027